MHRVYNSVIFPPAAPGEGAGAAVLQAPGFFGTYRPVYVKSRLKGETYLLEGYPMRRLLRIDGYDAGRVGMVDPAEGEPYDVTYLSVDKHQKELHGRFVKRREDSSPGYVINSTIRYLGGPPDTLLEVASGEDKTPQFNVGSKWMAEIIWRKT
jgi:hypothetical protein